MLTSERRMIVKGWKRDNYRVGLGYKGDAAIIHFVSQDNDPSDEWIMKERARIGQRGIPDWQPHITEVIVEEREVTEWRAV